MQAQRDGRNDFDFLAGKWKGLNRRLRERFAGSTDWETFEGRLVAHKILGGSGNFDEATLYVESGQAEGVNLRLYNPDTGEWAIYWASSAGANSLFPPMVGKFENERGVFYSYEPVAGQHIHARAIYTTLSKDAFRWEQAFSTDGGQSWETNWICDFTKED
jgi:hypothetical protein